MRVLDLGCSDGRGSEVLTGADGCDIYRPALMAATATGRRQRPVQADLRALPYADRSYDLVTALDVIEHLEKRDAVALVREIERISRGWVVLLTPSGFLPQAATDEEPWQLHRCGFTAGELEELGYEVRGVGGWSRLRRRHGRFRCGVAGCVGALVTEPMTRRRPDLAFHVVGMKHSA